MKKILTLALTTIMVMLLAACGEDTDTVDSTPPPSNTPVVENSKASHQ